MRGLAQLMRHPKEWYGPNVLVRGVSHPRCYCVLKSFNLTLEKHQLRSLCAPVTKQDQSTEMVSSEVAEQTVYLLGNNPIRKHSFP